MDTQGQIFYGTPVVPGVVRGPAYWLRSTIVLPPKDAPLLPEESRQAEASRFTAAARAVALRLGNRAATVLDSTAEILTVTASIAGDPAWHAAVTERIKVGQPAPQALVDSTADLVKRFKSIGGRMAERTSDLVDIRNRILAQLEGRPEPGLSLPAEPVVLLSADLSPADAASLDPSRILAVVTRLGGPTSHTAIVCRQLGIPLIVGASRIENIVEGEDLLINSRRGSIRISADEEYITATLKAETHQQERIKSWRGPACTADGEPVELLANIQDVASAKEGAKSEATGVGLLRTELVFLNSLQAPTFSEQTQIYRQVFAQFPGHKMVVRTLDSGSDKPVPFIENPDEMNPALGVRGIRTAVDYADILLTQLDAISQAKRESGSNCAVWVMAPMVSTVGEAREFAALCRERDLVPGIMIEVPSAGILAERFVAEVDFVSIGTNDLAQYVMAADRLSPHLAELTDPWQPAVLMLVNNIIQMARMAGKPVGVCGEAAADPLLACVLVGMGVTSLSIAVPALRAVGAQLSAVTSSQCQLAASAIADAVDPSDARKKARSALEN